MGRIKNIDDVSSALEDAKYYIQNALDYVEGQDDSAEAMDATEAVIDALVEGLRIIEYKYGMSSKEAQEVRKFIESANAS